MTYLLLGVLSALVATNQPAAVTNTNLAAQTSVPAVTVPDPNDPVEKEYKQLMIDDDAALAEVDTWIRDNNAFAEKGGGAPANVLNDRIKARYAPVRKAYEDFLQRHPDHVRAHLAFGSFLNDIKEEEAAKEQWEKARQLDPKNPAAWNDLANYYGHNGPMTNAFAYYAKASELNPQEPLYYRNLAGVVSLFRKEAMAYYKLDVPQVFRKAVSLYQQAFKLDPGNFELASDLAQTYYGLRPFPTDEVLGAWTNALKIAGTDIERQGVYLHLVRIDTYASRFADAHRCLDMATNEFYADLRKHLTQNLADWESKGTNAAPAK